MGKVRKSILFYLIKIFFVSSINYCGATLDPYPTEWNLNGFEQMKSDLFTANRSEEFRHQNLSSNDKACLIELNSIRNALNDANLWAITLVDAWGKLPSAFLEGDLYDFGGFRECFHIERNEQHYKTKYCLGQMQFDLNHPINKYINHLYNGIYPDKSKADTNTEKGLSPENGSAFTFGLCVPAACSMDYLESLLKTHGIKNETSSIRFLEHTCQFEENVTDFKTKDWLAIGFFVFVLILMLLSTVYDIVYTASDSLGDKFQLLSAFSVYSNAKSLLSYEAEKSPNVIQCLHGMRALASQWIVYVHTFLMLFALPTRNKFAFSTYLEQHRSIFVHSIGISVDVFFVISGILVTIKLLKHYEKTKGTINILSLYFHRYLRLTPLLAVCILYTVTLLRFLGDGPIWMDSYKLDSETCEKNWWRNLLYIQNYNNPQSPKLCLIPTWYLAVDMQLFIIAPFITYLIYRFKKKAMVGLMFVIMCSIGWRFIIYDQYYDTERYRHISNAIKLFQLNFSTHLRCSSWLIGVITGYLIYESKKRDVRFPKWLDVFTWMLSAAALVAALIFKWHTWNLNSWTFGISDTLPYIILSIALSYLIFASVHNAGGPIVSFLSHPLWQPLSRLSYATYLVHWPVLITILPTIKTPIYFIELDLIMTYIAISVISLFFSIIVSLAIESPIAIIEKIIFSPKKKD